MKPKTRSEPGAATGAKKRVTRVGGTARASGQGSDEALGARLDDVKTAELAEMFHLLGDATRLGIVIACLERPVAVSAIADRIGASPSLVSHHLRLLRASRILRAERRGKQVFYGLADDHIRRMLADMIEHVVEPTGRAP